MVFYNRHEPSSSTILTVPPSPLCHLWSSFWCYGFRRAHFNLDFLGKVGSLCVALSNGNPLFLGSCAMLVQAVPPLGRAGWVGAETQLRDATHWARSQRAAFKEFLQQTFDSSSFRKQRGGNMATTGLARRCTQHFFWETNPIRLNNSINLYFENSFVSKRCRWILQ